MTVSATYSYRAVRPDGRLEAGTVEATNAAAAGARVRERGLMLLNLTAIGAPSARRCRIAPHDQSVGLRMLATLVESGLPLARALGTFETLAPRSWQPGLPALREAVRQGRGLASALQDAALRLPPIVIGIIQAGEAGAGLAAAIGRAADISESHARLRAAVRNALAYPALLAITGLLSVGLLVGVVLPRFTLILTDLGQALPPATRVVMSASEMCRLLTLPALLLGIAGVGAWRAWTSRENGLRRWHSWLLGLPLIGAIRHGSASARILESLAALLEAGIPLAPALGHAGRAAGDAAILERMLRARERIIQGERLSATLSSMHVVTPPSIGLIRAGEESGQLPRMMRHAATIDVQQVQRAIQQFVRLLEPALLVIFGGIVALVAMALLQAVYSVRPS